MALTFARVHGGVPRVGRPRLFPAFGRYVAVEGLCRDRLLTTAGIPASMVEVLYNLADLERFRPRPPLPPPHPPVSSIHHETHPSLVALHLFG